MAARCSETCIYHSALMIDAQVTITDAGFELGAANRLGGPSAQPGGCRQLFTNKVRF